MSGAAIVAVLAGGRSRRMGGPKATAPFAGGPLIARPLLAAAAAGLEAVVVAKPDSQLPRLEVEVWHEPAEPVHPLVGLVTALERAGERPLVALACDMPFVAPGLLARLAELEAAVAVARVAGRLEPFPGRYEAASLPVLRAALAREAPLRAALSELVPVELGEDELRAFGDPARTVMGVNTPEELARAERELCI